MSARHASSHSTSATLIFRRGWCDPLLYLLGVVGFKLVYAVAHPPLNAQIEVEIGYSATRLLIITGLVMFFWGTIQGARGRIVVFIDDGLTPGYWDAVLTVAIVLGNPLLVIGLWLLGQIALPLVLPSGVSFKFGDSASLDTLVISYLLGLFWLYARLYAYNRGAWSAFAALVAKVTWCICVLNIVLWCPVFIMIANLTYAGPSLRR